MPYKFRYINENYKTVFYQLHMINRVWSSSAKQYSYWTIYNVNHNLYMQL